MDLESLVCWLSPYSNHWLVCMIWLHSVSKVPPPQLNPSIGCKSSSPLKRVLVFILYFYHHTLVFHCIHLAHTIIIFFNIAPQEGFLSHLLGCGVEAGLGHPRHKRPWSPLNPRWIMMCCVGLKRNPAIQQKAWSWIQNCWAAWGSLPLAGHYPRQKRIG